MTDTVAGKQCIVHASDRKISGKQACFDQSIASDRYSTRGRIQSEIKIKNGIHERVIPRASIVKRQAFSKIGAPHFHLRKHHFLESYNRIECDYILKSGKRFGRNITSRYHHSCIDILFPAHSEV